MGVVESGNLASPVPRGVSGLFWKLNRLRAMSPQEVAHRGVRWVGQKLEKTVLGAGRAPRPAALVAPKHSLFSPREGWVAAWLSRYKLEQQKLNELLQGRLGFFGHPAVDVGMPVRWHRDPQTGVVAPLSFGKELNYRDDKLVGDIKILWELGRHQHLIPLAVAYAVSGESRYRDAVTAQIVDWIEKNPYGLGVHWCSALELALRLISWAVVHSLLTLRDGEDGLFAAVTNRERLGRAIYQQVHFIRHYLSRHSSANNHLIGELTGLWTACCVFDLGREGDDCAEKTRRELEREALLQIYPDGVDKEQATYYHLWVLEYLLFTWIVGARSGQRFSEPFRGRILAMAKFLRDISPANGAPPQIGDADDGFVTRFELSWPDNPYRDVLAAVDVSFGSGEAAVPLPQKAFWYGLAMEKLPEQTTSAVTTTRIYPVFYREGGYAILGGDGMHVVFDAGSLGYPSIAAHGHADALGACLALDGEWWLVDPGTFAYHSEPAWRNYFRGTSAHNTAVIDGSDQSLIGGPFLWLKHAKARMSDCGIDASGRQWAEGSHDGYLRIGVQHKRRVELAPGSTDLTVADLFEGHGEHEVALYFHFAPDIDLQRTMEGGWLAIKSGSSRRLRLELDDRLVWQVVRGSLSPIAGWYSPSLGQKQPSPTLVGKYRAKMPLRVTNRVSVRV
jgi:hypothetical protein